MKKILNKRLEKLSAFIEKNDDVVLDVGCDHGLLGIYLVLNKKVKVVSSDINEKPLLQAKLNIQKYHLENEIETRLGDGLKVMTDDIKTIIISGMGTDTIIHILKDINNYPNVYKLVLSPNNNFPLLRKMVCELGFKITKEEIVEEKGKYYLISQFIKGNENIDYYFGKVDLTSDLVKRYYQYIYDTNSKIFSKLNFINKIKKINLIKDNLKIKKHVL